MPDASARAASGRIALGTVQFGLRYGVANIGGQVSRSEAASILEHAAACGVDTLDTAVAYGESEQQLGEIGVAGWRVVTKLPRVPDSCIDHAEWVATEVEGSLRRLGISRLYGVLVHHARDLLGPHAGAVFRAMRDLKAQGLVERIGASVYGPDEIAAIVSRWRLDLVQAPLNVFDRRLVASGWLRRLYDAGTEVHVRSIFLQGLLVMQASRRPPKFDRWRGLWDTWDAWLHASGIDALRACVSFALSHAEVSRVVVGVDSLPHFREILAAATIQPHELPLSLMSADPDLIDPSRWNAL